MTPDNRSKGIPLCLATLLGISLIWGGCDQAEESAPGVTGQKRDIPEQQFFEYTFIETSAGVTQWILESEEMQKFSGQRPLQFSVVKMDFFNNGVHFSTLTADSGSGNMQIRDVHVWGNVVLRKDDGDQLETEELYFDNEQQLIHNEIFNRMTSGEDVITGIGLEATPDLEYIRIKEQMQGDVTDKAAAERDLR